VELEGVCRLHHKIDVFVIIGPVFFRKNSFIDYDLARLFRFERHTSSQ